MEIQVLSFFLGITYLIVELSSPEFALELMILADEYLLPRLKQVCEDEIIKSIERKLKRMM